ncbi:hypothetical protein [Streptomyces acidiscabies]|nr:hypothetical protein [Streptomyces acidiscabies]
MIATLSTGRTALFSRSCGAESPPARRRSTVWSMPSVMTGGL